MELLEYWNVLLRRKHIIIITLILVVVMAVLYNLRTRPLYEANCKLLITERNTGTILGAFDAIDLMNQTVGKSDPIITQMEMLRTRPIMDQVIRDMGLVDENNVPLDPGDLGQKLKIEAIKNTNLISISFRDYKPEQATNIVNTLASVFVQQNQKLNQEEYSTARRFIEEQLKKQKDRVSEVEQDLLAYKQTNQTVALEQETTSRIGSLAQFESNKMEIDTRLKGAIAQEQELNAKINGLGAKNNPFYAYWWNSLEQIRNEMTSLRAQKTNIDRQVDTLSSRLGQLPPKETELARLMRDQTVANQVYSALLGRLEEVQINEAGKIANIKLVEPAIVPQNPVLPKKIANILLSVISGLLFGGLLAMLAEYLDDIPKSVEEVKAILDYSVLGVVPYEENLNHLFIKAAPRAMPAEAIRLIHTTLKYKEVMRKSTCKLLMTSALPAEGKTTLMVNLGISLAASGKRVALIDLDLRRPKLSKVFSLSKEKGVTNYLIGEEAFSRIMFPSAIHRNLTVIPAGTIPPNPTELIASDLIGDMIGQLEGSFDIILFDTPPVTLVAETLDLARYMDGIMLVVDMQNASLRALGVTRELFDDKDLPVLGLIINKLTKERSGYSYAHYNTAYGYGY